MNKKEFYEKRAQSYTIFDRQGFTRYNRALKLADIHGSVKVLDVACKHAFLLDLLQEKHLACDYYGIDISEKVIENLRDKKGTFKVCDVMHELPFEDRTFDYIFCLELIEHVENPTLLLNQLKRVLKDDGVLILSTPNPYNWLYIIAELFKIPDYEGHITSFTFQNIHKLADFCGLKVEQKLGTYALLPYTPHGIKTGNYCLFPSTLTFLAMSYIYRIRKQ
jgi:SAM-dependent methyltransferase